MTFGRTMLNSIAIPFAVSGCALLPASSYKPWAERIVTPPETVCAIRWDTRTFSFGEKKKGRYLTYSVLDGTSRDPVSDCAAKTTLMLVHGLSGFRSDWRYIARVFAEDYGFRVIVIDLLGHGDSGKPKDCHYGVATQGRILAKFIRELRRSECMRGVVMVGTSYGAASALEAARQLYLCSDDGAVCTDPEPLGGDYICDPQYGAALQNLAELCSTNPDDTCEFPRGTTPRAGDVCEKSPAKDSAPDTRPVDGIVMLDSAAFYCPKLAKRLCEGHPPVAAGMRHGAAIPLLGLLVSWCKLEPVLWRGSVSVDSRLSFERRKELEHYYNPWTLTGLTTRSIALSKATLDYIDEFRHRLRKPGTDARRYCGVTCPVLIMYGEHSKLVPEALAWKLHMGLPKSTLVKVMDCGHGIAGEKPHQVIMSVLKFVENTNRCTSERRGVNCRPTPAGPE